MAPFRQDSYFIIYPGSQHGLVQFGMREETLYPAQLQIPSTVYRTTEGKFTAKEDGNQPVKPLQDGKIMDLDAFLFYIKLVYRSYLAQRSRFGASPEVFDMELSNIPMLMLSHPSWTHFQLEAITQFVFEQLQINNFMFLPSNLACSYALGSLQNCVVIDIHAKGTDVTPILDYIQLTHLYTKVKNGGDLINEELAKLLPQWTPEQIEDLKRSPIFEILSEDVKKTSALNFQPEEDEGTLDVAALITSDRDPREILEEREKDKAGQQESNSELETNVFEDRHGKQTMVGKQRFKGCESLIAEISKAVGRVLSQIDDFHKLRAIWENIVIIGGTTSITGLKEALIQRLMEDHLVEEPDAEKASREQEHLVQATNKKKAKAASSFLSTVDYVQIPTVIRLAKYPDYFPEWKKHGYSELPFLGAQIVAKQGFGHANESFYITRERYEKKGPSSIWDVTF
ncbi:LANO_0H13124g1_1 [Lachancea nothofagi CBS 11611]|uniref:LANO_0H13124g1_1 n=1 Tax=Lachancea nothofagi CBS 11611 TaxID=1266666 RepID=A0A1G4KM99_9SACH|nr:LANO_0H13124g1_1 [Lachancea nothofagi CBS 11611]